MKLLQSELPLWVPSYDGYLPLPEKQIPPISRHPSLPSTNIFYLMTPTIKGHQTAASVISASISV